MTVSAAQLSTRKRSSSDLETIEIDLILEAVYRHYGYDFRQYAYASLKRRLHHTMRMENLS